MTSHLPTRRTLATACSLVAIGLFLSARPAGAGDPVVDHFMTYKVKTTKKTPKLPQFGPVELTDQFGSSLYDVKKTSQLALPADKNGEGIMDAVTHLKEYQVKPHAKFEKRTDVRIVNQCNDVLLEVKKPVSLLVPASKDLANPVLPPDENTHFVDHFLCYKATAQKKLADGTKLPKLTKGVQVRVTDQFDGPDRVYDLKKITKLCNPVAKVGTPLVLNGKDKGAPFPITPAAIRNPVEHLVCYQATLAKKAISQNGCEPADDADKGTEIVPPQPKHAPVPGLHVNDQFGPEQLDTKKEVELCIPSAKNPVCGNGVTELRAGEECDDGGTLSGDGCSAGCRLEGSCAHHRCETGVALDPGCDPCVASICLVDAFCCDGEEGEWDGICVSEVSSVCGQFCETLE